MNPWNWRDDIKDSSVILYIIHTNEICKILILFVSVNIKNDDSIRGSSESSGCL